MAVRDAEGQLWLSSKSRARFVAETWLRRNAQASAHEWPRAKGGAEQEETKGLPRPIAIRCDSLACIANAGGQTIAFVDQPDALAEDCGAVDIVISAVPVRRACDVPHVVIDRFDLWRHGAHAVYLNDGTASVQTVGGTRGARPWALPRGANSR